MGCLCCRNRDKSEDPDPQPLLLPAQALTHSEAVEQNEPTGNATEYLNSKQTDLSSQTPRKLQRSKTRRITSDAISTPEKKVFRCKTIEQENQRESPVRMRVVLDGVESCYQLEKGNFGLLVRAECRKTKKKCWIQTFEVKRNKSDEERLLQLQLVQSLDHPNILKLLDLFQDESHFYAVYEVTEGGSAEELCTRTGGVSEQWTSAIMRQVLAALSHCHSTGLLLKTLSVKHVLFTETPTEEHTSVKLLIPIGEEEDSCLAPELKSGAYIGPANDLWSCGVLLSTLLAGECVIINMQAAFTSQEFRGAYKRWQEASQKVKCFTLALMTSNFDKRPTVEKCLQHPWLSATR